MTIPEDMLTSYLNSLLGRSDPGDTMHHLLVAAAAPDQVSPLGLVDKAETTIYAIAPDSSVDVDEFTRKVIATAAIGAHEKGQLIHFAGLAMEAYTVYAPEPDEVAENLARRLQADGKLDEHPSAVEVTLLYAACSDGRRWTGRHVLTGPTAGMITGPDLHVGGVARPELQFPHHRAIRALVGMGRRVGTL